MSTECLPAVEALDLVFSLASMWLLKVRLGECCSHIAKVLFYLEVSARLNDKLVCTAQVLMVIVNCCEACGLCVC